ncbi:ABC transporter ATP-binding protein [Microlunatus soli]|uniref:ABC-2 type transport system ATP-binding protein n=1 Tax=Microlunatus soli TaxID=630515 RepID=A0A1H1ZWQ6_9ACTN|nr:ATP-binding cassette domain-containing protein [Microlunatus soli]SDT38168.1 ABC-2 type transport system ATP-binding protein [Microlunatus soli]
MSGPAIRVDQLGKTYLVPEREGGLRAAVTALFRRRTRAVDAVRGISFGIEAGEVVGFLGPNGAGKTTTLKMLSGLLHPSAGAAEVFGYTPWQRDRNYLGRMTLIMGQRSQLQWDIPVVDSYRLNKAIFQISDADFAARLGELTELLELSELLRKPARNLSLGERMKCEFAGSLLHRPQVLFLDEPTIGLDVAMQRRIRSFVAEYNARTGACVILTSHYMADVEALCKRVIVIHHGELLFDGPLTELVRAFAPDKTITVELVAGAIATQAEVLALAGQRLPGVAVQPTETGWQVRLPSDHTAAVAGRLLAGLEVADLTIEEEPIEAVIEKVFAVEAGGHDQAGAHDQSGGRR